MGGLTRVALRKGSTIFWDNFDTSIKLHNIKKPIVINHKDCGAAKIANGDKKINSSIEHKMHKLSFKNIKIKLRKKHPKVKINFKILSI